MFSKVLINSLFIAISLLCSSNNVLAWNDKITHRDLSEKAFEHSVLNQGYLRNIGFNETTEFLEWVKKQIKDGAIEEDAGNIFTAYYYNHFHNPLRPWNQAGLSTIYPGINGMSSLIWAQDTSTPNPWRWQEVRNFYYLALTSTTNTQREEIFAKTFKGLGHVIHLIEDKAQPAHVRDDPHILDDIGIVPQFENWAKYNAEGLGLYNLPPVFPTMPINISEEPGYIPITQFWDTDQYNGTNPPSGTAIGISEYTNANFFSEDTINSSTFPYPDITQTTVTVKTAPSGTYQRQYYLKNCCGETKGGQGYLLAAVDFLDYYRQQYPSLSFALPKIPILDDNVYQDYASLLLPRAVGYSAGLLNYFFRGQMAVSLAPDGIIVKNTSQESMDSYTEISTGATIGSIAVYYDAYDANDINGKRTPLADYPLFAPLASGDEIFISFIAPSDNIKQNRYIVVFYGKLGNEEGAVVGKINSEYIYYVSDRNGWRQIFRMDADNGTNPTLVYNNSSNLHIGRISVSPDGKTIAFGAGLSPVESNIYLIDLTGGSGAQETLLVRGDAPAWSPDGSKIAYERESGLYLPGQSDVELYTIEPATKIETQLTNVSGPSYSAHPAWSPDGTLIAYSRFNANPQEYNCANFYIISLIDISGQPQGAISCSLEAAYTDFYPAWSPDGNEIAFTRKTINNTYQLYKVNRNTSIHTELADSSLPGDYDNIAPAWSPDGSRIAVGAKHAGNADIWLVNSAGGYLTNLTDINSGVDEFPAYGQ